MIRNMTDKLIFDYYQISSSREEEVYSPFPFYIDKNILEKFYTSCEIINSVVIDIIKNINGKHKAFQSYMGDFFNKEKVLNLESDFLKVFWCRFDGFIRENGKDVFFSEFNYDKPCMQREIIFSSYLNPKNDPNKNFKKEFKEEFYTVIKEFTNKEKLNIGLFIDPCHYEEMHLTYFFTDILKKENVEFIKVGPNNIYTKNKKVYAFEKPLDVILRLFPTEHFNEINDVEGLMEAINSKNVLMINDPRVLIGQAKSLFAYLYDILDSNLISERAKKAIKETLPYTKMLEESDINKIIKEKDKWVIKAIYGRYSEEVYIGILNSDKSWSDLISKIKNNGKKYILQEFCPIHKDMVLSSSENSFKEKVAYGNFGIYLNGEKANGIGIRWSSDYLTNDDTVFMTPIGIRDKNKLQVIRSKDSFKNVNEKALFDYHFTGGHTKDSESFTTDYLLLSKELKNEIESATNFIGHLINKTFNLVMESEILLPNLGIDERLFDVIKKYKSDILTSIGRLDFVVSSTGEVKILEFNSETPAGLVESIGLSEIIKKELNILYKSPNENMKNIIKESFKKILNKLDNVKTIGFLCNTYYEDWYNTLILKNIVEELGYKTIMGNIYDVYVDHNKLCIYGEKLDTIYRYFPLDWFLHFENREEILKALEENTISLNEPKTFVYQTKVFFALIYELLKTDFYSKEERDFIEKYIPKTVLDPSLLDTIDFCIKPILEREGDGIVYNFENKNIDNELVVYQERVDIQTIDIRRKGLLEKGIFPMYPIIGSYISGNKFCGIYTRVGGIVTNSNAMYIPTYYKE